MSVAHRPATSTRQPEPESKQVGIWLRVSTEDQARGDSPEHHEKRARHYAEAKGWSVREVYHLEAVSGKAVLDHPEARRMLDDIASGHITGLIFSKLARLARNTRELLEFADRFRDHDADLISLQESIDTSTPAGRFFFTLLAAMATWEREEIADRVAVSVPIRAKLGKPLGGAAPFGYRWERRELVPDPKEAPVRKLLYELFVEHRRKKTVARLLNAAGHRTRNGSKFSDTTVDRLLRDPTARGTRRANYTKSLGDGKRWVLKPKEDWVETPVPAIVPEELWDHANAVLDAQRNGRKPAKKATYLFSGYAVCDCGQKMYVPTDSVKYVCYRCRNKIPIADLEAVFAEQLRQFVFAPGEIAGHLASADEAIKHKEELVCGLDSEAQRLRKDMDRTLRLYLDEHISKEGFAREYRPMEERLKQLEDEVPVLQGEIDFLKIQYLSRDEILSQAQDLYGRWSDLTAEEKRQIVEQIVEKITVSKDEVAIDLAYLPTAPPQSATKRQRNFTGSWRRRA